MSVIADRPAARRVAGVLGLALVVASSVTLLAPVSSAGVATEAGGPGVGPDPAPESSSRARELLVRVAAADEEVRYKGAQFVSAWTDHGASTAVVDVKNVPGRGTRFEIRGSSAGEPGSTLEVPSGGGSLQLGGGPVDLLADNYTIRRAGSDTVAGRTARVLEMFGADRARAARLWVDAQSGLLLRREVYDDAGRTVRASAYFDVRINDRKLSGHFPPMSDATSSAALSSTELVALRRTGCTCPDRIGDHLALFHARVLDGPTGQVLHLSYSDGLSTVSIFEQPGRFDETGLHGFSAVQAGTTTRYVQSGLPHKVIWTAGGIVYTVVADAPTDVVDQAVAALPADGPDRDGVADRVGRGLTRVASWVNPFA